MLGYFTMNERAVDSGLGHEGRLAWFAARRAVAIAVISVVGTPSPPDASCHGYLPLARRPSPHGRSRS